MTRKMTEEEARQRLIELGRAPLENAQKQFRLMLRLALTFVIFMAFEIVFFISKGGDFNKLYLILVAANIVVVIALLAALHKRRRTLHSMRDMLRALYDGKGTDCLARLEKLGEPITVTEEESAKDGEM